MINNSRKNYKYNRIDSEIKKEIQIMLISDIKDPRISSFVNVVDVIVNKDLSFCKVYVSIIDQEKNTILKALDNAKGYIRYELAHRLNLRRTPEIKFYLDTTDENAKHIEELLNQINKH